MCRQTAIIDRAFDGILYGFALVCHYGKFMASGASIEMLFLFCLHCDSTFRRIAQVTFPDAARQTVNKLGIIANRTNLRPALAGHSGAETLETCTVKRLRVC